jgi:hypothetical protein
MAEATKKEILSSNTYDANVRDKLNEEPTLIYYGSLDNSGEAQVEDTFKIPAGYAVQSIAVDTEGTSGSTVDEIAVGTTAASGEQIVAGAVLTKGAIAEQTLASTGLSTSDQIAYIHTLDGTSATYDIVCDYTIVLKKIFFTE